MIKFNASQLLTGILLLLNCAYCVAQPKFKLGMSTALSGPAKEIGQQLTAGAMLHFTEFNQGLKKSDTSIELLVKDDGYEPNRAVANTRYFIYQERVNALFGTMGTPTTFAIKPLLEASKIPLLMPYTGADFLHQSFNFNVFNLRASYADEAEETIKYLVDEKNINKIGLLIQADEFGLTVEKSLTLALKLRNLQPTVITRFRRNTADLDKALSQLEGSGIKAIAMVGTYEPLATFINNSTQTGHDLAYTTVSFASSKELFKRITQPTVQLMVTEVVPDPSRCSAVICQDFRRLAKQQGIAINEQVFEGYLNAYVLTQALSMCQPPIENACVLNALTKVLDTNQQVRSVFMLKPEQNKLPVYRSYF
ncbi:ABC transporter substrate-binding protein [Pseudoalteromonas sp. T1lg65]|uniref:ABC transporter substrate-binding protein n=1 Tax=Pseudoalteromonas sp. T1lg65 TaxID=2077101 RepID=UPI003F79921B